MKRKLSILLLLILCLSVFMGTVSIATEVIADSSTDSNIDLNSDTSELIITPLYPKPTISSKLTYYRLVYELSEDGTYYSITKVEESDVPTEESTTLGNLVIPESYNGLPVKFLADSAFKDIKGIKYIDFGKDILIDTGKTALSVNEALSLKTSEVCKSLTSMSTTVKKYYSSAGIGSFNPLVSSPNISVNLDAAASMQGMLNLDAETVKFKGEDIFVIEDENGNKTYLTSNLEDVTEEYIKSATWSKIWIFSGSGLAAAVVIAVYCTCNCLCKKKKEELPPPDGERPNPPDSDDPNPPDDGRPTPPLPEYPSPDPELPIPPPVIEEPEEPKEPPRDKPTPPPHNPPVPPQKPRPPMYGCILTIIISITFIFSVGAPYLSLIHNVSMWVPATISSASAILIFGINMVSNSVGALDKFIPYRRGASSFISLFASFFILGSLGYWHPGWAMTIIATIVASLTIVFTVFLPKVFIKIAYFRIGISLFLLFTGILFSFGIMEMWNTGLIIYAIGCAISIIALILEFIFKKFILKSLTMRI